MMKMLFASMCTVLSACAMSQAAAGRTLYNGIVLPGQWPPRLALADGEPMPVPYLRQPPEVITIDLGRQLLVDDFLIEQATLRRSFHRARYHPASPVLKADKPWEQSRAAIPYSDGVWYDPQDRLFKMWYEGGAAMTCYAESKDGIHWEKPPLDVVPGTNIVLTHARRDSGTVWLDHYASDPRKRYKAAVFIKAPSPRGLWLYVSADGIHWSEPVAKSKNIGDRSTFFYNPFRKVWVWSLRIGAWGERPRPPRARAYREHADFVAGLSWREEDGLRRQDKDLYPWVGADRLEPRHPDPEFADFKPELYNLDAMAYESLLVGMFSVLQGPSNPECKKLGIPKRNEVLLGFSRDGFHWHRPDRRPFLAANPAADAWNWGNVQSVGGGCLVVGDELYFYVSGRKPTADGGPNQCSTGLAVLRRDGFASMDAGSAEGTLTTRPLRFGGKHLFVNVDADGGQLRAEVLDHQDRVIEPFSRNNCPPISADETRVAVRWNGADDLSALSGKPVKFRFILRGGSLYSFWVSAGASGASGGYVAGGGPGLTGPVDTQGSAVE